MSQKELKKSDKKQKIIDINHEFLINFEKNQGKILEKLKKTQKSKRSL